MLWLVYLPLFRLLEMQFFELKLVAAKISYFDMTNFWVLDVLTIYQNISKIRLLIQISFCRNGRIQLDLSKKNCFSVEEAMNYICRTENERRYQYLKYLNPLGFCLPPCFQFYHGNRR